MLNFNRTTILSLLFLPVLLSAQISVKLPAEPVLIVNGKEYVPSEGWTDSLITEAENGNLKYEIVSAYRYGSKIETRLNIPQFFHASRVYRQIILYYAMLGSDTLREAERIQVYPYYSDTNDTPWISCTYKAGGRIDIRLNRWIRSKPPEAPTPEEKYVYNEIIKCLLENTSETGDVPQSIFEKVAEDNELSVTRTKEIYQNVQLWHLAD